MAEHGLELGSQSPRFPSLVHQQLPLRTVVIRMWAWALALAITRGQLGLMETQEPSLDSVWVSIL